MTNLIFVFSDQQRYTALGTNGNEVVQTPNLDRLAAEGMACDNVFSNHPLCSPFRAQLLTGRYGWANGVIDNEYLPRTDIPTFPGVLRDHGHHTGHIGTWHLGEAPFTEDKLYGLDHLDSWVMGRHGYWNAAMESNDRGRVEHTGWSPTVETDLAIEFLDTHVRDRGEQPFALWLSWRPPHWPYAQHPDEFDVYDPTTVDLPGNVPPQMAHFARKELAHYYACCTGLDHEMGRLLAALDRLAVAEDTIVCYSSDHGDHLSSHGYGKPSDMWMHPSRRASKSTPYDEACHIPFLIRWPGVTAPGSRTDAFFGSIDFMPSLLSACGVPVPDGLGGRDVSSVWRSDTPPPDPSHAVGGAESVYLMNMANGWPDREQWVGRWRGVRTERYTYARWFEGESTPMLFDRWEDPLENINLLSHEIRTYRPELARAATDAADDMEERLREWMRSSGDPFDTGPRGPRGFLEVGQRWADPDKWAAFGTS